MKTDELIRAMAADTRQTTLPLGKAWLAACVLAILAGGAVFFYMLGPRSNFMESLQTARFVLKFVVTLALALSAFVLLRALARPGADAGALMPWLLTGPLLLVAAVAMELFAVPASDWATRLIGANSRLCLTFIPLIGAGPLAIFLLALRQGAPTRPRLAGMVAGLLAGGLAAAFYASHCPDDSPLFVATWYTIAIAGLAAVGALLAPHIARW